MFLTKIWLLLKVTQAEWGWVGDFLPSGNIAKK